MEFFPPDRAPYPQQRDMVALMLEAHAKHENAIICAPTGCGKTLAELCAAAAMAASGDGKIYVLSRTHSQIKQLVAALSKLPWAGQVAVLSSRDQSCCNAKLDKFKGPARNDECSRLREHKACEYHHPETGVMVYNGVEDIEDLVKRGKQVTSCAYYAARAYAAEAQIIVAPYNYVLDPSIRSSLELDLTGDTVIFDEAHNIERILCDAVSADETRAQLKKASEWFAHQHNKEIAELFTALAAFSGKEPVSGKDVTWPLHNVKAHHDRVKRMVQQSAVKTMAARVLGALCFLADNGADYAVFVSDRDRLHIACLHPAVGMRDLDKSTRSLMLVSGTLVPFDAVASELGVEFPHRLQTGHVADMAQQALVRVVPSWGNRVMDARYENAQRPEYLRAVGEALLAICKVTPNGVLFFVSSYPMLERLMSAWGEAGLMQELREAKGVFIETGREQMDMPAYRAAAASAKGALCLAVYRGKLAEGVDFADMDARCVVCLGIPFAPYKDTLIVEKKKYNNRKQGMITGDAWYTRQAALAVSQALGRCIRHPNDFGGIVLLDQAFLPRRDMLPEWCRAELKSATPEALVSDMAAFFARHEPGADAKRHQPEVQVA